MKVGILIWNYWPGLQGGAERQARMVGKELVKNGHECEVFTAWISASWPRHADDEGIKVHRLGVFVPALLAFRNVIMKVTRLFQSSGVQRGKGGVGIRGGIEFWLTAPLTWLARLSFILEFILWSRTGKISCDLLHLHEPLWLGGVAQLASQRIGCSVVCQEATSPALPVIGYDTPFRGLWSRLRMEPEYIAMADYTIEQLIERGIPRERIHLLPSGVNVPPVSSKGMDSLNCLYVANFSQGAVWKAFDVLFAAWAIVAKQVPEARLYAVGGGDATEWKRLVKAKGVGNTVVFTGTVREIEGYYSQSSVFLLPSRVEGMSNALLEAQMWGLACVVSDIQGNKAVVENGVNGVVVPVNDVEQLANATIRLLRDAGERKRLGHEARESAVSKFGIQSVVERLVRIYKDVLIAKAR